MNIPEGLEFLLALYLGYRAHAILDQLERDWLDNLFLAILALAALLAAATVGIDIGIVGK